ncbi:unnamed protein product, partial [Meganyctiphanes norvegica]
MDLSVRSSNCINSASSENVNAGIHDQYTFDPQFNNDIHTNVNEQQMQSLPSKPWLGVRKDLLQSNVLQSMEAVAQVKNGYSDSDFSVRYDSNFQYPQSFSETTYIESQIAGPIKTFENISNELSISHNDIAESEQLLGKNKILEYSDQSHNYRRLNYIEDYQGILENNQTSHQSSNNTVNEYVPSINTRRVDFSNCSLQEENVNSSPISHSINATSISLERNCISQNTNELDSTSNTTKGNVVSQSINEVEKLSKNNDISSNILPRISVVSPTTLFSSDVPNSIDTLNHGEKKELVLNSSKSNPSSNQHQSYIRNLENDVNHITSANQNFSERATDKSQDGLPQSEDNMNTNFPTSEKSLSHTNNSKKECNSGTIYYDDQQKMNFKTELPGNNSKSIESVRGKECVEKNKDKIHETSLSSNRTIDKAKRNTTQSSSETNKQRTYKCECCDAKFKTSYELERHGRIHSGERPFKCDYCSMSFKHKHHVEVHMRRHVEDRRHSCNICGMLFMTSSCLLRHKRRTHSLQEDCSKVKYDNLSGCEKGDKNVEITNNARSTESMSNDVFDFSDETKDTGDENKEKCKNIRISDAEFFEGHPKELVNEDQKEDIFVSSTQNTNVKEEIKNNGNRVNNNLRMKNINSQRKRVVLPPRESNSRTSRQRVSYAELDDRIENFVVSDEQLIPYKRINLKRKKEEEAFNACIEELGEVGKIISSRLGNQLRGGALTVTRKKARTVLESKTEEKDVKDKSKEAQSVLESKQEEKDVKDEMKEFREVKEMKSELPSDKNTDALLSDSKPALEQVKSADPIIKPNKNSKDTNKNSVKLSDNQFPSLSRKLRNRTSKKINYSLDIKDEEEEERQKIRPVRKGCMKNYSLDNKDDEDYEDDEKSFRPSMTIENSIDIKDEEKEGRDNARPARKGCKQSYSLNKKDDEDYVEGEKIPNKESNNSYDIKDEEKEGRDYARPARKGCKQSYSSNKKDDEDYVEGEKIPNKESNNSLDIKDDEKEGKNIVKPVRRGCRKSYPMDYQDDEKTLKPIKKINISLDVIDEEKKERENTRTLRRGCKKNYSLEKKDNVDFEDENEKSFIHSKTNSYSLDIKDEKEEKRENVRPLRRGCKKNYSLDKKDNEDLENDDEKALIPSVEINDSLDIRDEKKEEENVRPLRRGCKKNYSLYKKDKKDLKDEENEKSFRLRKKMNSPLGIKEKEKEETENSKPVRRGCKKHYSLDKKDDEDYEDEDNEESFRPIRGKRRNNAISTHHWRSRKSSLSPKNTLENENFVVERAKTRPTRSCKKNKNNCSKEKSPLKEGDCLPSPREKTNDCEVMDNNEITFRKNEIKIVDQSKNQNEKNCLEIKKDSCNEDIDSTKENYDLLNKKVNEDDIESESKSGDEKNAVKNTNDKKYKEDASNDSVNLDEKSSKLTKKTLMCKQCDLDFCT